MSEHVLRASAAARVSGARVRALRRHPVLLALVGLAVALGAAAAIAASAGFGAVGDAFKHIHPAWLALTAAGQVVGVLSYAFAYRVVACFTSGPKMPFALVLRLVAAGFGAFTVGGGFLLDYDLGMGAGHEPREARIRVLGLGAVEYAVLAPVACVAAIVLLADGSGIQQSLLWPWALAVPLGFTAALLAAAQRARLTKEGKRRRLDDALNGVDVLRRLAVSPRVCAEAVLGMGVYWASELVSLWAALEAFGAHISAAALIVAYATGYAATRRTLPLGGAGTTEALLTYALHWVGVAIASALAAVLAYRLFNFALTTLPALHSRRVITPLLMGEDATEEPLHSLIAR